MHKTCPTEIKAAGPDDGLAEGQFRALVSVFNNTDSMGDVVVPGAFDATLKEWAASGDRIPVYWSHQMHDPDYNIGWVDEAAETEAGLEVLASLDLADDAPPKARQVYRLMKGRRVTQFSFAYDVLDEGQVEKNGQTVNELRALKLYEVGPTPVGANTDTELLGVKADAKAGRVLSAKNEKTLRDALDAISGGVSHIKGVLAQVASDDGKSASSLGTAYVTVLPDTSGFVSALTNAVNTTLPAPTGAGPGDGTTAADQEKANAAGPVTGKEPPGVTSKEPSRNAPVSTLAAHLTLLALEGDSHAFNAD